MKTKSLFYTLLVALLVGLVACGDKDEPTTPPKKKIDLNAVVNIRAQDKSLLKTTNPGEMSYEDSVKFITRWGWRWNFTDKDGSFNGRGIGAYTRDTVNHKFTWVNVDVIYIDPTQSDTVYKLGGFIADYTNMVVVMGIYDDGSPWQWDADQPDFSGKFPTIDQTDTVAYIPNKIVLAAREKISEAFDKGDYDRVYELFDSAFVFIPTTGERYRALMEKGEN